MSRIKVGDFVTINENAGPLGESFYRMVGIVPGATYAVTGVAYDEDESFNEEYGGYVELDGKFMGFVMDDFDVVAQ